MPVNPSNGQFIPPSGNLKDKGYFLTEAALIAAYPVGEAGWKANIEETDSIWLWDADTAAWVDSKTPAGNYLSSVSTDDTLTGNGTAGDPLGLNVFQGTEAIASIDAIDYRECETDIEHPFSNSANSANITKDVSNYEGTRALLSTISNEPMQFKDSFIPDVTSIKYQIIFEPEDGYGWNGETIVWKSEHKKMVSNSIWSAVIAKDIGTFTAPVSISKTGNTTATETGNMLVAGAGTTSMNGTYVPGAETVGKPSYDKGADDISWSGTLWKIRLNSSTSQYQSAENVDTPDIVTTWTVMGGDAPAPTVSKDVAGSPVITDLSSTTGLEVGMIVSGTGIAAGSRILSIDSSSQITLDTDSTAAGTGVTLTFLSVAPQVYEKTISLATLGLTAGDFIMHDIFVDSSSSYGNDVAFIKAVLTGV